MSECFLGNCPTLTEHVLRNCRSTILSTVNYMALDEKLCYNFRYIDIEFGDRNMKKKTRMKKGLDANKFQQFARFVGKEIIYHFVLSVG